MNGTIHRYDRIRELEYQQLSSFVSKHFNTSLDKVDLATKGWNWGTAKFKANALDFVVGHHTALEIPLNNVSYYTQGKNEVTLEFHQTVSLKELRFHIPLDQSSENDPVNEFYKNVMSKADIIQATGDAVSIFQEVQCLTPIKLYPTFLQLHRKTFDYKIPYTTILDLFLQPHKDGRQKFFVVSLDPPIKQGQKRYPFLILLFNKDDKTTLGLGLKEEDKQEKYKGKLQKEMSGPEYEIISWVMKTLMARKITVPGSCNGMSGSQCVQCSCTAVTGYLYPLERGFMFVHKQHSKCKCVSRSVLLKIDVQKSREFFLCKYSKFILFSTYLSKTASFKKILCSYESSCRRIFSCILQRHILHSLI